MWIRVKYLPLAFRIYPLHHPRSKVMASLHPSSNQPSSDATVKATEVLNIPELFEAILLDLPPHDLLLAQAVSTVWRDAIKNSSRIQQALFFKQLPPTATTRGQEPILNPFSRSLFGARCSDVGLSLSTETGSHLISKDGGSCKGGADGASHVHAMHCTVCRSESMQTLHGPSSWRGMYVSDRPCSIWAQIDGEGTPHSLKGRNVSYARNARCARLCM